MGLLAASCDRPQNGTSDRIERVVLVCCDTLRADRLGVYGYPYDLSPNLDRFARECVVFDGAWSTAPATSPAMSTLFTGRYPDELGVRGNRVQMPPEIRTLPETLRTAGIETAAVVSNWVLSRENAAPGAGVAQGFGHFDDRMTSNWREQRGGATGGRDPHEAATALPDRGAPDTTDAAIEWLEARRGDRFFLWVHYQDPHGPYTPPEEDIVAVDRPLTDESPLQLGNRQAGFGKLPLYQALGDARHPEFYRIRYDAEIRYFDRELGRLLEELERRELMDGTLLVVTADHGESLGEHDHWFAHGQHIHGEVVRIPLIVRYPEGAPTPNATLEDGYRRVERIVSLTDIAPTILQAFGLRPEPGHGVSLLTRELPPFRPLAQMGAGWYGITDGRYRVQWNQDREIRLYNLETDPGETRDLSTREPARVRALMESFEAARSRVPSLDVQGVKTPEKETNERALDALGYGGGQGD